MREVTHKFIISCWWVYIVFLLVEGVVVGFLFHNSMRFSIRDSIGIVIKVDICRVTFKIRSECWINWKRWLSWTTYIYFFHLLLFFGLFTCYGWRVYCLFKLLGRLKWFIVINSVWIWFLKLYGLIRKILLSYSGWVVVLFSNFFWFLRKRGLSVFSLISNLIGISRWFSLIRGESLI